MSSASSRSSRRDVDAALEVAADRILEARRSPSETVLIDGRSGVGKTSLAGLLAARWGSPVVVLALDDVYPGWDGLDAGVAEVLTGVLEPRADGDEGTWHRWDWETGAVAESHRVPSEVALIVEGSGILTAETAATADIRVWLDAPADTRRERALARDGDLYGPHWDRWAAQEAVHLGRDDPAALATLRFDIP